MNTATRPRHVRLNGQEMTCACCNAKLTRHAVETAHGVFGRTCWSSLRLALRAVKLGYQTADVVRSRLPAGQAKFIVEAAS